MIIELTSDGVADLRLKPSDHTAIRAQNRTQTDDEDFRPTGFADQTLRRSGTCACIRLRAGTGLSHARSSHLNRNNMSMNFQTCLNEEGPEPFLGSGPSVMASWCLSLTSAHTNPNLLHAYCM